MSIAVDRIPWWLWPHVLALDAPAVAVVWQRFLATAFGVKLPVMTSVCLAFVVWGVYLLDRGLDARPGRPLESADRHRFAGRHSRTFIAFGAVALVAGFIIAVCALPIEMIEIGMIVGALLAGYFLVVQLSHVTIPGSKELAVGLLFAAGVGVPLVSNSQERITEWLPAVVGFAAVCWLNCLLIDHWEHGRQRVGWLSMMAVLVAIIAGLSSLLAVNLTILGSLLLLAGCHGARHWLTAPFLRVAADGALLTPLLVWWSV